MINQTNMMNIMLKDSVVYIDYLYLEYVFNNSLPILGKASQMTYCISLGQLV